MRDSYTNKNHCPSHKCGRMRGMVVGEGGRCQGFYCTESLVGLRSNIMSKIQKVINHCDKNIIPHAVATTWSNIVRDVACRTHVRRCFHIDLTLSKKSNIFNFFFIR